MKDIGMEYLVEPREDLTRERRCWRGMIYRCYNKKNKNYANYGGRGIRVCSRWIIFENFFSDMGKIPEGLSIDRIDNNGNYEKNNCRWATAKEQAKNRREKKEVTIRYKIKCKRCKKEVSMKSADAIYCSIKCRDRNRNIRRKSIRRRRKIEKRVEL